MWNVEKNHKGPKKTNLRSNECRTEATREEGKGGGGLTP